MSWTEQSIRADFSAGADVLRRIEEARKAREDRMRNALEILAGMKPDPITEQNSLFRFVRATAREGLGRE